MPSRVLATQFLGSRRFVICYRPLADAAGLVTLLYHQAGGRTILQYWVPAEDFDDLNKNIVRSIEVVAEYR